MKMKNKKIYLKPNEKHLLNPNPISMDRVKSGLGKVRPS